MLLCPTWRALAIAVAALAMADVVAELSGGSTLPGGPVDELAHLLSALLIVWVLLLLGRWIRGDDAVAVISRRGQGGLLAGALAASVLIDIDHVPGLLGARWLSAGTPRPYTHSLLTICGVLLVAALWRSRRPLALGAAAGVTIHLWRDLAEPGSGVALLWPFSDHGYTLPHLEYAAVMGVVVAIDAWLVWQCERRSRPPGRGAEASPDGRRYASAGAGGQGLICGTGSRTPPKPPSGISGPGSTAR